MKDDSFQTAYAIEKPGKFLHVFILDVKYKEEYHSGNSYVKR